MAVSSEHYHCLLFQTGHNQMLAGQLCDKPYPLLRSYRHRPLARLSTPGLALLEHRQILNAMPLGDGEQVALLMYRHVTHRRRRLARLYAQQHAQQQEKQP
ncbi:FCD domain-containing protein [Oceanisphaera sp. KMM 10153]|uniref:FCD domain-containing protein n=1 Tax=Oceanisphaera submarina TaxID=3390193 RepID=UPI00397708B0